MKLRVGCSSLPLSSGLPADFHGTELKASEEPPCIVATLCELHDGLLVEAKGIKEHYFKPYIAKLFDRKVHLTSLKSSWQCSGEWSQDLQGSVPVGTLWAGAGWLCVPFSRSRISCQSLPVMCAERSLWQWRISLLPFLGTETELRTARAPK